MSNWSTEFYNEDFARHFLLCGRHGETEREIGFLDDVLHLKPGDTVFDQCCGVGRLSLPLARRGCRVIGVDIVPSYISWTKRETKDLSCRFYLDDACDFIPAVPCDVAVNWWTSFGYFTEDEKNIQVLQRAYDSLKPGGMFVLDFLNAPHCLMPFQEGDETVHKEVSKNITSTWISTLSADGTMIKKTWECEYTDGRKTRNKGGGVKLYTAPQLRHMLTICGFENILFFGDLDQEPLKLTSPRCIAVARKGGRE